MLQALRRRIVQQLNSIRSDVARTAAGLAPLPEEAEAETPEPEHPPEKRSTEVSNTSA